MEEKIEFGLSHNIPWCIGAHYFGEGPMNSLDIAQATEDIPLSSEYTLSRHVLSLTT